MLKSISLALVFSFFFTACSFKLPFIGSKKDYLAEANSCKVLKTLDEKLYCYEKIIKENSYAQLRVGVYHAEKKNYKKALELFNNSYKNKNPYSNLALVSLYFQGKGVKKDTKKAFELLSEVSSNSSHVAYRLSKFYFEGIHTKKDNKKALELLSFAGNKNMKLAQYQLYDIYTKGLYGIKIDEKKAIYWNKKIKENIPDKTLEFYSL